MNKRTFIKYLFVACVVLSIGACKTIPIVSRVENISVPASYLNSTDTVNTGKLNWNAFFKDAYLTALIDSALSKNQDLAVLLQEIQIAKNEVKARRGAFLPFVNAGLGAGVEKVGKYTSQGASDASNEIMPGKAFPDPLQNYMFGLDASWEIDIWKKLRNAKKSALHKYLSSIEGKNFMVTHLIAEIANAYYELVALDNQLAILRNNIEIQQNALEIVKLEKIAAKVSELAVRKFEAEVLKNQSRQYYILQQITETENRINFLVGRFPQKVDRSSDGFIELKMDSIHAGIPNQLLSNRTDIRQAEQELIASKLDVKVAKAQLYPSLVLTAGTGFQAFNPQYLLQSPQSLLYNLGGSLMGPLINRNAIKANFNSANAKQIQAIVKYEQSILRAHIEVVNQLSNITNLKNSFELKERQVQALTQSIDISTTLFKAARADYMEVLLTQRDALDSKFELIETKKEQMNAMISIYQALGGGWR